MYFIQHVDMPAEAGLDSAVSSIRKAASLRTDLSPEGASVWMRRVVEASEGR